MKNLKCSVFGLITFLLLQGCSINSDRASSGASQLDESVGLGVDQSVDQDAGHRQIDIDHPDLRFVVIGDWGNYGNKHQQRVAKQMNALAGRQRIDFIVTTGDNIYDKGVQSISDPLWKQSFEDIYNLPHLKDIDWYVTLGNHDYQGNYRAQIDYSVVNPKWILPSPYHSLKVNYLGGTAKLLLIDTNTLKAHYRKNSDKYFGVSEQDPAKQLAWLTEELKASPRDESIIVAGHNPLYGTGTYGNDQEMINLFAPLFNQYKVQAYFAGHDHTLQHQAPGDGTTHYFISGAGAKLRDIRAPQDYTKFAASQRGFAYVTVSSGKMSVVFIGDRGQILYETELPLELVSDYFAPDKVAKAS